MWYWLVVGAGRVAFGLGGSRASRTTLAKRSQSQDLRTRALTSEAVLRAGIWNFCERDCDQGRGKGGRLREPMPVAPRGASSCSPRNAALNRAHLQDPTLLYVTLIARTARLVPHAVRLAEEIKRKRYKASGEELMQYILPLDDDAPFVLPPFPPVRCPNFPILQRSSLRPRNLFVSPPPPPSPQLTPRTTDVPPVSIKIFLSRLALDELLPLYKPRKPTRKPDIRPPIQLSSSAPPVPPVPQGHGKLKKGKNEEPKVQESGGFWGSFK